MGRFRSDSSSSSSSSSSDSHKSVKSESDHDQKQTKVDFPETKSEFYHKGVHIAVMSFLDEDDKDFSCSLEEKCSHRDYKLLSTGKKKVEYKDRYWHEDCFHCYECKVTIGTGTFYPHDRDIYCNSCYLARFIRNCMICDNYALEGIIYQDEPYHHECFRCTGCNDQLPQRPFKSHENSPYCMECYAKYFAPRCHRCTHPIIDSERIQYVVYDGRNWHTDCFACERCHDILPKQRFFRHNEDITCKKCIIRAHLLKEE